MKNPAMFETSSIITERIEGLRAAAAPTITTMKKLGIPQRLITAAFMLDQQTEQTEAENMILRTFMMPYSLMSEEQALLILNGKQEFEIPVSPED